MTQTTIPLFVRDDTILIEQEPELTTTAQADNDMTMKIYTGDGDQVSGSLFWDDGQAPLAKDEHLYMNYVLSRSGNSGTLTASCEKCQQFTVSLNQIKFIGSTVTSAEVDGTDVTIENNALVINKPISDQWSIALTFE